MEMKSFCPKVMIYINVYYVLNINKCETVTLLHYSVIDSACFIAQTQRYNSESKTPELRPDRLPEPTHIKGAIIAWNK